MKKKVLTAIFTAIAVSAACVAGCATGLKEVEEKAATCESEGNIAYYTDGTNYYSDAAGQNELTEEDIKIPALGHDYSANFVWNGYEGATVTLTCSHDGAHTHSAAATVTSNQTEINCAEAKVTYTATLSYGGRDYSDEKEQTVSTGKSHTPAGEYGHDANKHWKKCSECGVNVEEAHSFEWKTDTEATETTPGVRHEECVCGEKRNEDTPIPPTGTAQHVPYKAPTCTEAGNKEHWILGGNYFLDEAFSQPTTAEDVVLFATGRHTLSGYNADNADADNHWKICSVCHRNFESEAHSWDWVVDTDATETTPGSKHQECTVCHFEGDTEVIPPTGSEVTIYRVPAKEPDCTHSGNIEYWTDGEKYYSDENGETEITQEETVREALGHDWSSPLTPEFTWTGYAAATAKFECKRADCGHYEEVNAVITSQTTEATCGVDGETVYTATATFNDAPYTDTKTQILTATGEHDYPQVSVYDTDDKKFYQICSVCGDKKEIAVGEHKITVNGNEYDAYSAYNTNGLLTYDAIANTFVVHVTGTDAININVNNAEGVGSCDVPVIVKVESDVTIPSFDFVGGWVPLTVEGDKTLTVTGAFNSEATTTLKANINIGGETKVTTLNVVDKTVTFNSVLRTANLTVGDENGDNTPVLNVNTAAVSGITNSGVWGASNYRLLSGTVTVQRTGEAQLSAIDFNGDGCKLLVGEHATLKIKDFVNGSYSGSNNAEIEVKGNLTIITDNGMLGGKLIASGGNVVIRATKGFVNGTVQVESGSIKIKAERGFENSTIQINGGDVAVRATRGLVNCGVQISGGSLAILTTEWGFENGSVQLVSGSATLVRDGGQGYGAFYANNDKGTFALSINKGFDLKIKSYDQVIFSENGNYEEFTISTEPENDVQITVGSTAGQHDKVKDMCNIVAADTITTPDSLNFADIPDLQ